MNVCVVGGGAAGMMAAIAASERGCRVTLIEQNEKLGKKLFLTGKGRCNLTNSCDLEELFQNIPRNPKFLYSSIYGFDNNVTVDFFESLGLRTKEERGNRIFPVSDHSSDVIAVLARKLKQNKVEILLNTKVIKLCTAENEGGRKITGVMLNDNSIVSADAIILAVGGKSYPSTGSDGASFEMLRTLDMDIVEMRPSLVPMVCADDYVTAMQGLSLKNVTLNMEVAGKKRHSAFGEMLFTHFGVSGPLVLSASAHLSDKDFLKDIMLYIDFKPALSTDELDRRILKDFEENQNKIFENALGKLLPSKAIDSVVKLSKIPRDKRVNLITREERQRLAGVLKAFPVKISGLRGFNEAIITRGGISVKEINPSTMESKKVKGLYFAGEMIDVDAYTGGFNLQIAWSTGHLAGESCADI